MAFRTLIPRLASLAAFGLAFSSGCEAGPGADAPPDLLAAKGAPSISGTYRVSGTTEELQGGASRRIDGTIVLTQDGDSYTASFQLSTLYPGPEGEHQAAVIGNGEGSVHGGELAGTAHTQIVVAAIPGMDTDFAFAPRAVTTRVESASKATIQPDGAMLIEIETSAAEGESYRPSRTRLSGERIAAAPAGNAPPVGAAPDPVAADD